MYVYIYIYLYTCIYRSLFLGLEALLGNLGIQIVPYYDITAYYCTVIYTTYYSISLRVLLSYKCTILYYIILYYNILYYIILYYIIL